MIDNKTNIDPLQEMFNASLGLTSTPQTAQPNDAFVISYPKNFDDVQNIINGLKRKSSCLVNFNNAPKNLVQRMIDFISGACFALDCTVQKIQDSQYLITASGVSVKVNK